jgi:hypothetical protein
MRNVPDDFLRELDFPAARRNTPGLEEIAFIKPDSRNTCRMDSSGSPANRKNRVLKFSNAIWEQRFPDNSFSPVFFLTGQGGHHILYSCFPDDTR